MQYELSEQYYFVFANFKFEQHIFMGIFKVQEEHNVNLKCY